MLLHCRFEVDMEEKIEYDFGGAPVVYSDQKPKPYNPLNRPKINYKKFILSIIGFALTVAVAVVLSAELVYPLIDGKTGITKAAFTIIFAVAFAVIYVSFIIKKALIWLVHLYQHYAPDRVRLKCVFEPSCSEYMILSIEKYGVIKGVFKGLKRLLRCHPPNGGRDDP